MKKLTKTVVSLAVVVVMLVCFCGTALASSAQWSTFPQQSIYYYDSYAHAIQAMMYRYSYTTRTQVGGIDGIFGNGTDSAVRTYQDAEGLSVDGIVGSGTWGRLWTELTARNVDGNYQNYYIAHGYNSGVNNINAVAARYDVAGSTVATHWYAHGRYENYIYCGTK